MILEVFEYHNKQIKDLVGHEYAPATLKRDKTSIGHARSFIQWKYGIADIDIKKLDYEFISEYAFWFKSIRRCNHNTTMKYLGNFKKNCSSMRAKWMVASRSYLRF
ncbi:MAG: phage integrase SAM-like domain-containing protein [Chitinophagaceae bacterium]